MSDKPKTEFDEDEIRRKFHLPAGPYNPAEQDPEAAEFAQKMARFGLTVSLERARQMLNKWKESDNEQK